MSRDKKKEYIFSHTLLITQETTVMANTYEEAENTFCSGGGDTDDVDCSNGDWECIQNPDISFIKGMTNES
jgi:hypothetical protein|tara:strand:- start:3 stop:215 length:213 start_codon:yes stop_codon:yes gene_type:complete